MPRKGEARNIRPQVLWAVCDSQTDTSDRGAQSRRAVCRKSGTHGDELPPEEAEVQGG